MTTHGGANIRSLVEQYLDDDTGREDEEDEALRGWYRRLVDGSAGGDVAGSAVAARAVLVDDIGRVWQVWEHGTGRWVYPSAPAGAGALRDAAAGALASELGAPIGDVLALSDPLGRPVEIRSLPGEEELGVYFVFAGALPLEPSRTASAFSRWAPFDMLGHQHLGDKLIALAPGPTQAE